MRNRNRIILNTAVSYASLLIMMVLGLITVRVVLQALGEVDYGIYVLVAGIVTMLDILSSDMTNTSMRYLAYSLGRKDKNDVFVTFNSTIIIHYIIGAISVLILEIGGAIIFGYIANIPPDRIADAKIIYQFMVITTFVSIISVPYDAVTNAHEKIWFLSICNVVNNALKLVMVCLLLLYPGSRLVLYGLGILIIQILMRVIKVIYAKRHFVECRRVQRNHFDKDRIKEILSFTGWNLFSSISAVGAGQLRSLVINYFFGVRLNAAEGVSGQVRKPLNMMVTSMTKAINPQIMKSEGGEDRSRMHYLVEMGAKYSSFLFALLGVPVFIEIPFLFDIWLENTPEFAEVFCRITILGMLLEKTTFQLTQAITAVGKIRNFQIASVIGNLIYLPIAFVLFKMGYHPVTIYWLSLFSILLNALIRFYYGKKIVGISPAGFIKTSILPLLFPLLISTVLSVVTYKVIPIGFLNLIAVFSVFCISFVILFFFIGMNTQEREQWKGMLKGYTKKIKKSKSV